MEPNRRADGDHVSTWQLICMLKCFALVSSFANLTVYFVGTAYITIPFWPCFKCFLVFVHKLEKTRMEHCTPVLNTYTCQTCICNFATLIVLWCCYYNYSIAKKCYLCKAYWRNKSIYAKLLALYLLHIWASGGTAWLKSFAWPNIS
jgi:hypothetical protein